MLKSTTNEPFIVSYCNSCGKSNANIALYFEGDRKVLRCTLCRAEFSEPDMPHMRMTELADEMRKVGERLRNRIK